MNRAERRQRVREDKPVQSPGGKPSDGRQLCPFPNCGRTFIPEEKRPPFCNYHIQFVSDFGFCVAHVRVGKKPEAPPTGEKKSSLILPDGFRRRKEGGGP